MQLSGLIAGAVTGTLASGLASHASALRLLSVEDDETELRPTGSM